MLIFPVTGKTPKIFFFRNIAGSYNILALSQSKEKAPFYGYVKGRGQNKKAVTHESYGFVQWSG